MTRILSTPLQNHKLLLRLYHSENRKITLQRSKKAALRKGTSVDKARFTSTSIHDDKNDPSENLDDMIQRVNSKIEKLIESTPTDSDQLPNKIEEPFCVGHSSDSEPDPEEPSSPKDSLYDSLCEISFEEIDSLYETSFEELLATCNALVRENHSLKMELAAVNEILTSSPSVKELTSPAPAPQADLTLPIRSRTAMVSSSKGKCRERSQSVDVRLATLLHSLPPRHPVARAYEDWLKIKNSINYSNSEGSSSLPQSPELSLSASTPLEQPNASPVPDSAIRYTSAPSVWEIEEYVQYHKEPIAGGWREFYTPRSMHTSSTKLSRKGSKSVHVYRSLQGIPHQG